MFRPTETDGVYQDDTGRLWPLDPRTITQLQNNGQIVAPPMAGGGGGVTPPSLPNLDPRGRAVQAVPYASPQQQPINPQGRAAQTVSYADAVRNTAPQKPVPAAPQVEAPMNLQRVMPRQQESSGYDPNQRIMQRVAARPAEWVPTARQSSGISEGQQSELAERVKANTLARVDAETSLANEQAAIFQERTTRLNEQAAQNALRTSQVQSELDTKNAWIQAQQSQIGERMKRVREMKVDSGRVFDGPEGKLSGLLGVIATAFGQYASIVGGGPNVAAQMFQNMIDRDVEEQRANISKAQSETSDDRDYFERTIARSADEEKAMIRALEIEKYKIAAEKGLNEESLRLVWPQLKQILAEADSKQTSDLLTVNQAISRTAGERFQPAQAGGMRDVTEQVLKRRATETGYAKQIAQNSGYLSGGIGETSIVAPGGQVIGNAPTPQRAEQMNERLAAFNEAERLGVQMQDIIDKQKKSSLGFRDETDKALYSSLATRYKNALWSAVRSDAPSETESEAFAGAMGGIDLANFRTGRQSAVVQQTLEDSRNNLADRIEQNGGDASFLRNKKPDPKNEGQVR